MKQHLLTLFLALAVSVGTLFAQSGTCGDNLTWTLDTESGTLTISGTGAMTNYTYSSNAPWYSYSRSITTVIIEDGVTSIGEYAFWYCESLTSVTIPSSVTSIGNHAFYGCINLTSITIPNSVTSIGLQAFAYCRGLTSVTIGNSVTSIGLQAFENCCSLTSMIVKSGNPEYDSRNNCNAIIETATNVLIAGCKSTIIPNSVTSIGERAFYNCSSLTSITIPNSVTSIGGGAFCYCSSLTSITIPNSVTSIGGCAFAGCSSLTSITVDSENPNYCDIDGVLFDKNKTTLIRYPQGKSAISYTIPSSVKRIEDRNLSSVLSGPFTGCRNLTSITIPNSVTSIGDAAFYGCSSLTSITIPNSVTNLGDFAFYQCSSLTSVTIGNSVTSIGDDAFIGCSSLTSITIPNSVISIGYRAFDNCSGLTSVTIPNSVTSIGNYAFYDCSSLTSITCEAVAPPTLGYGVFDRVDKSIPLYVPAQSIDLYKAVDQWKDFTNILPITSSTPAIFTITFLNYDGSELQSSEVEAGTMPQYNGTEPTKPADAQYTYTFAGWDKEVVAVTGDATYIATYSQSVNQYTVTFVDYDGTALAEPQTLAYGETPVYTGDTPTRPADAQFTYLFSRWSPDITAVTGDITYTAVYSYTVNQYTVTFLKEDGTIIESKQWNYGSLPVCWTTPTQSADGRHAYVFAGWTPILSAVTGDATYTATFNTIEKDTRTTVDMMQEGRIIQGYYDFDIVEQYGYANTWGWKYYDVYDNLRIRHISDPSDTDPHIGIKAIPDNHSSSIRLATRSYNDVRDEDGNITDGQTAAGGVIGYVFTVTEQNAVAVLDYAAMLEYPESHETSQNYWKYYQPWVQIYISVVDDNGNNYPQEPSRIIHACMAPEGLQGWHPATTENGWEQLNNVPLYDTNGSIARNMVLLKKDWSSVGFDLRAVMGKKVCVWCEYYDCAIKSSNFAANFGDFCWDHHMARLYSALSCTQAILQKEEETCEPTASVTYSAPEGFTYRWYTAANPNAIISTDRLCTYQFAYVGEQETLYCEMQSLASMSPTTLSVNIASQCKYPLVIEADGRGTVTKIPDQETYEVGTEITLIPELDERPICFMGWEGPDAQYVTYNGYGAFTFTMPAHDAYLRAEFRECTIHMDVVAAICESELPYHWAEADITFYESGYKEHVFHTASGADSIVTLHLNVLPSYNQVVSATIYEDELPYYWEGLTFTEAGTQTATLKTVNGCDSVVTFTLTVLFSNIVLQENEDADYYTQFANDYNGVTVTTATLNRQFTQGKWATLCLPFNVNKALMTSLGLYNRVFELRYAEQLDDETIQMYFAPAQSIEAGKGYIVNANSKLAQKTSFVFPNVTINTDSDNGDITALTGYNDGTNRGNLYLVGTLRTGILQGTTTGNTYLGLKDNKLYYPNSTSGTPMRAYRAVFRCDIPVNASRLRIIADGETVTELQVVGTDSSGWSDKSDQSHKSDTSARKYIDKGILYIERNGNTYNAQGQSVEQMNCK